MAVKHRVGPLTELPEEEGKRIEIGGHRIAVFRRGQSVYAVGDSCPHMGASLSDGYLDGRTVICPWHGWVFDLETGASPFDDEARVAVFRVLVEDGDVFLEIEDTTAEAPCAVDRRSSES